MKNQLSICTEYTKKVQNQNTKQNQVRKRIQLQYKQ